MILSQTSYNHYTRRGASGSTLAEVVMAVCICTIAFTGILKCYTQTAERAQWAGYSLAAQALAIQQLEQARSGIWDPTSGRNETTNLNLVNRTYNSSTRTSRGYTTSILDVPIHSTNTIRATNFVTVRTINVNNTTNPPVQVQMVRVDTVWPLTVFGSTPRLYTNTVATYLAPDDR